LAFLRLEEPLPVPALRLARTLALGAAWESFLLVPGAEEGGAVAGEHLGYAPAGGRSLLRLVPRGPPERTSGMSGAPIVSGDSLLGIVWGSDRDGGTWYALPVEGLSARGAAPAEAPAAPRSDALAGYASDS